MSEPTASESRRTAQAAWNQAHPETMRESMRRYRAAHPERARESTRQSREAARAAVLDHYGRECACCGTGDRLSIDHINGDGAEHRAELFGTPTNGSATSLYRWLIRQGFPPGFQVLCGPCNSSKGTGARCQLDHQEAHRG